MTPKDKIEITGLKKEDVKKIALIEKESFSEPWSEKSFEEDLSNPLAFYVVLKKDNETVGYIGTRVIEEICEITTIAVSKPFRRQGFAYLMLLTLIERLPGVKTINLEVRSSNLAARSLYEKHGFKECGIRKGYYDKPREDAILYTRYAEEL